MLFVRLEASATPMPLPTIPELDDPAFVYIDVARDLPYDYSSLLENVLDVSHVPFTHHATVSNRVNGGPVELEVVAPGVSKAGFSGLWQEGPRKGKLGPQHTRFVAPSLMYHSLVAPSLGTTLTVVYGTPTTPGRVRLLARFPFKFNSAIPAFVIRNTPRWVQHQGQNGVLEDDVVFLAVQEQELAATEAAGRSFAQSCFMPLAQDAYVLAFRAWLARFTRGASPWPAGALLSAPRAQSKEELLDRYLSHTVNCVSCMAALRGVRLARTLALAAAVLSAMALTASLVVAALAPASAFASPVAAALALLASLLGWNKLGAVEQGFIAGPLTQKRNLVTKQSTKNASTKIKLV
jgi:phenylpropionate dioxygenase-like ring-hydroxylating dioxygenase large terminal subunit